MPSPPCQQGEAFYRLVTGYSGGGLPIVYLHRNQALVTAIANIQTLLRELTRELMLCRELMTKWPDYIGVKDASKYGVDGIIVGELLPCPPTVFCLEWSQGIKHKI